MPSTELKPVRELGERFMRKLAELREARSEPEEQAVPVAIGPEVRARRLAVAHLRAVGYPEKCARYIEAHGLAPLLTKEPGRTLRAWAKGSVPAHNAVLYGGVGSGKTTLSALALLESKRRVPDYDAAAEAVREADVYDAEGCLFIHAFDLMKWSAGWSEDRAWLERLERVPLLVLDDLAVEAETDAKTQDKLQALFLKRDANDVRTVVTTNADPDELRRRYGERVADRLRADAVVISCGEVSLRKRL